MLDPGGGGVGLLGDAPGAGDGDGELGAGVALACAFSGDLLHQSRYRISTPLMTRIVPWVVFTG
jgi:hypothetical protein